MVSLNENGITEPIINFSYNSDKGRDSFIDHKGRVYFVLLKSEIRNKSRLHWLWWKLDSDPASSIYYATEPDPKVAELAYQIKKEYLNI